MKNLPSLLFLFLLVPLTLVASVTVDKAAREVRFKASPTGVGAGDIAEFYIITENSGHDYEALFQTTAKATEIRDALISLGVPTGEPIDYEAFKFWSKGERIEATVKFPGDEKAKPLDSLVTDKRTDKPVAPVGFVFIGATNAETAGPGSIIPTYNETVTILDVPRRNIQDEVYEKYRVSADFSTNKTLEVEIILKPETRPADSPRRVMEMEITVTATDFPIEKLRTLAASKHDVFVTVKWDDALPISKIRDYARLLKMLDADSGIRVAPPADGDPYYHAFDPRDDWRVRENRFAQPCELRFAPDGAATLVAIKEIWGDDIKPELKITEIPNVTPDKLPELMKGRDNDLKVLLVFAPASLPYSAIRPFISTIKSTHPNIHVFTE